MIFAGAESARFRSDLRFPVPGLPPCRCVHRAAVAGCLYVHEIFSMRDAAACPTDCCPPAARFLPCAACRLLPVACCLLSAFCCVTPAARRLFGRLPRLPVRVACGVVWHFWRCDTRIVPAPSVVPAFPLSPDPFPDGTFRKKVTAHPDNGCAADGGICLPLFGEFPGSPAGVGLGPQP